MPTFLQWNCRSARKKKNEFIFLINKFKPSIFAVQETWLLPGSPFRVSGYSCLRDDRSDGYAGAAILVSRSITFNQIIISSHDPSFNVVAVRASNISFLSVYIPNPTVSILSDIKSIISSLPPPVIILGDFNIHHTSWGSHFCDDLSSILIDISDDLNLCFLNDGSPTRRVSPSLNPKSAVDLTFCSPSLSSLISWCTLPNSYGSDHFPIVITMHDSNSSFPQNLSKPLSKFILSKANWSQFRSALNTEISHFPPVSYDNVLIVYALFRDALLASAKKTIPVKNSTRDKIPSPPWWDIDCTNVCRERKKAEQIYSSSMSNENWIEYKRASAIAVRTLSEKKKFGWNSFCESLSPQTPPSLIWRNVRRFRGAMLYEYNVSSNDSSEWLDDFCSKLAPPSVPSFLDSTFYSSSVPSNDKFDAPFSQEELSLVLSSLKNSSPGLDGIPYAFLVNSSTSARDLLLNILNYIFSSGIPPEDWKTQIVIPILKPGKPCKDSSSYRPIALSCTMAKILEHLVKNRLEWFMESKGLLSKSQFGFRKGLSTTDSLSLFVTDIRLALSKQEFLVGLFLDISSAYDNVLLSVLRQKLLQLSVPVKLVNFISNLFSARSVQVKFENNFLPPRMLWKGLPQGSVLSPLLYSIYTSDLDLSVNSFCDILQYADDLVLYVSSKDIDDASSRLNSALFYLGEWLENHGLSLSIAKSSVTVFTRRRHIPDISISFNGQEVPVKDHSKFLGVILDSKLSGVHHLNHVVKKCEKSINILRSLSGVWWGSHPYTQKLLYNSLVRSHLDYGSFLLEPCNKSALVSLDKIQSKCLRIICGAMKSSPINALQIECSEPPLHLRRQYLSDRFFYKVIQLSNHPLISKLHSLSDFISSGRYWIHKEPPCLFNSFVKFISLPCPVFQCKFNPLFDASFESIIYKPNIILDLGIDKNSPSADSQFNRLIRKDWSDWLSIFTDASKISDQGCVGSAVWIPKFSIILNFKCPSFASVFTGESIAVLEALQYVESHKLDKTIIFSDSKSCLQAILANQFTSKTKFPFILKIKNILFKCQSQNIRVILAWIPGHCGIHGNEVADNCAKEAINSGILHDVVYTSDLIPLARKRLFCIWDEQWKHSRTLKGRHYADIQNSIPPVPWFFKYRSASKRVTSTICRLRLGHSCTPVHLAKIRIKDSSICECGLDEGTPDHIFFSCPNFPISLYDLLPPYIPRPTNFKLLLSLVNSPFVQILCNFINFNNIRL